MTDQIQVLVHAYTVALYDGRIAIHVNDQSGQLITFTMDQPLYIGVGPDQV